MNKFIAAPAAARKPKGMLPSYSSSICFKRHRPFERVLLKGEYQNEKEVAAKKDLTYCTCHVLRVCRTGSAAAGCFRC